ncbi:hypothetical protein ABVL1U2_690005 [Acinetobacter baumannii]|nr:hypothetical protein ABVL1U2_690005 [Acinetobacter baumannii]
MIEAIVSIVLLSKFNQFQIKSFDHTQSIPIVCHVVYLQ